MSMELFVLSDRKLESIADWQTAIDGEGFALRFANGTRLKELSGFLPMQLDGRKAGCECEDLAADEILAAYADIEFDHRWQHALALRFGGDIDACIAAYMAGSAYARATDGCVLDGEEGRVLTPREAVNVVRELLKFRR